MHLLEFICSAKAMAEHIDGLRAPYTHTAGVFDAIDDGVRFGVGRGPILANAGVGGPNSGVGSRYRGRMVDGVGVLSIEVDSMGARLNMLFVGVGVAGVGVVGEGKPLFGSLNAEFNLSSMNGIFSRSGVNNGTIRFQVELPDSVPMHIALGGLGVYRRTMSCHFSNRGLGR